MVINQCQFRCLMGHPPLSMGRRPLLSRGRRPLLAERGRRPLLLSGWGCLGGGSAGAPFLFLLV